MTNHIKDHSIEAFLDPPPPPPPPPKKRIRKKEEKIENEEEKRTKFFSLPEKNFLFVESHQSGEPL
jgi:hypothetical protein